MMRARDGVVLLKALGVVGGALILLGFVGLFGSRRHSTLAQLLGGSLGTQETGLVPVGLLLVLVGALLVAPLLLRRPKRPL